MPIAGQVGGIRAAVVAAVDRAFAEPVPLSFFANDLVDPDRAMTEISAVLRVGGDDETNLAGGFAQSWKTKLSAGKAELHIDRSAYQGPFIRVRDKVCALSRLGQPWWDVLAVEDRGDGRLVLRLGEI